MTPPDDAPRDRFRVGYALSTLVAALPLGGVSALFVYLALDGLRSSRSADLLFMSVLLVALMGTFAAVAGLAEGARALLHRERTPAVPVFVALTSLLQSVVLAVLLGPIGIVCAAPNAVTSVVALLAAALSGRRAE